MKIFRSTKILLLLITMLVFTASSALAGFQAEEPPAAVAPCGSEISSGIVVDVEGDLVIIKPVGEGEPCSVTLEGSDDHPIVALLGMYYDANTGTFQAVLDETEEDLTGCAIHDPGDITDPADDTYTWAPCDEPVELPLILVNVKVIEEDENDGFIAMNLDTDETIPLIVDDPTAVENINGALSKLFVNVEDGSLHQVSDEIAKLHDEGMGFGVIVKLYSIANAEGSTTTVEELVELFNSGTGMGHIFKMHGKPSHLGVGHVRQDLKNADDSDQDGDGEDQSKPVPNNNKEKNKNKDKNKDGKTTGICNALAKGKPKAKGKGEITCPPQP